MLQVARLTGTQVLVPETGTTREDKTTSALDAVWERFREPTIKRVDVLEDAVIALLEDRLGTDQRRAAEREAHKLAGSAGTFGFPRSSTIAREIENKLGSSSLGSTDAVSLAEQVLALRSDLEGVRPASEPRPEVSSTSALILIVEDDPEVAERLVMEAEGRGIRTLHRSSVSAARSGLDLSDASAALVRIHRGVSAETLDFIAELEARTPPVSTMVVADNDSFPDRIEVVRRGVRRFIEAPAPPGKVIDALVDVIAQAGGQRATILAVDDDLHILAALRAILEPRGLSITTLDDPLRFWEVLEEVSPDLIILDIDMPHVSGLELCRVVRSEPRWLGLPVLFLTARTDVGSIQRAFTSGADDYLGKPIVASELVMRLNNRLERVRLNRELAETDVLTGIPNRRKSSELLDRFLKLARRKNDLFSVAVLDLDRFKQINDRFGHAAGDNVLRSAAQLLSRSLRAEDVIGRWGGEEFTVGLYGTNKSDGAKRLSAILEGLAAHEFVAADGSKFHVTCSGGVAQLGIDGSDLESLHRVADSALYEAKAAGRNRVVPSGLAQSCETERIDVLIVDDDDALVGLLEHSLRTRGLSVRSFGDGEQAAEALAGDVPAIRTRVILLDVDLPGLNGLDVLRRLNRANVTKKSKVVMLTARTGEGDVLTALDLGAIDHITKPFSVPVLLQKVQVALRAAEG
ncbi:MAG: response regulator [Gemmatimonadaceae bacterium]